MYYQIMRQQKYEEIFYVNYLHDNIFFFFQVKLTK
jgi:hypothetical protein